MRIGLTGHRTERLQGKEQEVREWLIKVIDVLSEGQPTMEFLCGCADGADEIFGMLAYEYPKVHLTLCKPTRGYRFGKIDKLVERANGSVYMVDNWRKGADSLRDKYIADNCDVLLAVWDGDASSGVCGTIKFAQRARKPVIYCPKSIFKGAEEPVEEVIEPAPTAQEVIAEKVRKIINDER